MHDCLRWLAVVSKNPSPYIYVLVHIKLVPRTHRVYQEIEKIKREETYVEVRGNQMVIPTNLPRNKTIRVCGAYRSLCVTDQLNALQKAGYKAEIYQNATMPP